MPRPLRLIALPALFALLAAVAPSAGADLVINYSHQSRNSSLNITYSSGSHYNYGYGFGGYGGGFGSTYGFGGSSIFVVNGGSFSSFNGYLLPGVTYRSPFYGADLYGDPLGFAGARRRTGTRREIGDGYDRFDAEALRRQYYGVEGKDSPIPGGVAGTVAARLARTEAVRAGLEHFRAGRYAEASQALREAYLRNTGDAGVKIFYGLSLVPLGEYAMAEKALQRGIEESGTAAEWLVEVPKLYGNPKDLAGHLLLLAHRKDKPDPRPAAFLLAYFLAADGRYAEARAHLDSLGAGSSKAVDALRALIQARMGG